MLLMLLIFSQFSLADSLYANKYFDLAYIEYERAFFFDPDLKMIFQKRVRYAIALFHFDQYRGIREFHNILQDTPDLDTHLKVEIARCYLDSGYAHEASCLFIQTGEKRLLGFTFLFDNRLHSAREVFGSIGDTILVGKINGYLEMPKKSPRTAAFLSAVCPGAGEIYGGNTKLGIQDFLLNLGSGFLIYNAMRKKKYIDAALVFSLLFNRFYIGSIHNAQKSAQKTNEKSRDIWFDQMKQLYFKDIDQQTIDIQSSP